MSIRNKKTVKKSVKSVKDDEFSQQLSNFKEINEQLVA